MKHLLSQYEMAKADLAEALAEGLGEDSAWVKGLRAQIAMHDKPRADNPVSNFQAGFRGAPSEPPKSYQPREERMHPGYPDEAAG